MKLLPTLIASALLSACTSAPPHPSSMARGDYTATKEYASQLIRYEMKRNAVQGLSIALVDDQRVVWAEGFGLADQEKNIPATADTVYRVGSISKLFTATAAMQLAEQGKLDIDQPLQKYIPNFSIKTRFTNTAEITPRLLMTHHSGLPRDRLKGFMTASPAPFATLVDDIRDDYAAYPPSLIASYSNLGVSLLGVAIQNQSSMPFADYMHQSLLAPLSMTHSSFDTGLSASALAAKGYRGRKAEVEPDLRDVPAGGLNSSVSEMSRFMSMIFAGGISGAQQIIQKKTLAEMLRPQNSAVALDFDTRVGLAWWLNSKGKPQLKNGGTIASHNGSTGLFHSQMYLLPEHKMGVIVLSNSSTAGRMVEHVAIETLASALEAKTGIRQREEDKLKVEADPNPLTSAQVQEYVGDYTTMMGMAQISVCGDGLCARAADSQFKLLHGSDGLFRLHYSLLGLIPIDLGVLGQAGLSRRTLNGREVLVARIGEQEALVGQRIAPPSNLGLWRGYLGEYENTNLGADHKFIDRVKLIEAHGYLFAEVVAANAPAGKAPLFPLSETEAILTGALADSGETVSVVLQDGETRLLFGGYLFKKMAR
ncbi:MAG: serine hydrolase [Sideroxydans sp.]|nr:serine hydrolase [Sideroxydans sp.]